MWINPDVDLPQTLVTAQREGRLVIFAGAGGADRAHVRRIAGEMLCLGLMDGERLRRMTDDMPGGGGGGAPTGG